MKQTKKLLAVFLSLLVLLGSTLPAMAEDSYAMEIQALLDDAEEDVTITLTDDVTEDIWFTAKEGLTYTITGKDYTLSSLVIDGKGTVIIHVKAIKATADYGALEVNDAVQVTVTGDIIGYNAVDTGEGAHAWDGITAQNDAVVTVTGNVIGGSAEGNDANAGDGIYADGNATVTVIGDVTGGSAEGVSSADSGNGIVAYDNATIKVTGNVTAGSAESEANCWGSIGVEADAACKVEVTGNVTGGNAVTTGNTEECNAYAGTGVAAWGLPDDKETPDVNEEVYTTITVKGDVTAGSAEGYYAYAGAGIEGRLANVTVEGDVTTGDAKTGEEEGNAYTGDGIYASEKCTITVNGDVTVANAEGYDATVGSGIYADSQSAVTVTGDVTVGLAQGYYAMGGNGIYADYATVTVTGNITAGSAEGVSAYVANGIFTYGASTVTVKGNVTGGDLTATAEEDEEDGGFDPMEMMMGTVTAGHGVMASMASDITIEGDVTGGSAKGELGDGGVGMLLSILLPQEPPVDGVQPENMPEPGKVTVTGTVTGGQSKNGTAGVGIYYTTTPNTEFANEVITPIDTDMLFGTLEDYLKENDSEYAAISYMYIKMMMGSIWENEEDYTAFMDAMQEALLRDQAAALKVEIPADLDLTDTESEEYEAFTEKLELAMTREAAEELGVTVPENLEELDPESAEFQAFLDEYYAALSESNEDVTMLTVDRLLRESGMKNFDAAYTKSGVPEQVKDMVKAATLPTVSVGRVSTAYGLAVNSALGDTLLELLGGDPAVYNVTIKETKNGTVKADKTTAKAGETVTLTVTPAEGYVIDTVKAGNTVLKAKDGVYTTTMVSGGIDIVVTFKAKPAADTGNSSGTGNGTGNSDYDKSPATGEAVTLLPTLLLAAAATLLVISKKRRTT